MFCGCPGKRRALPALLQNHGSVSDVPIWTSSRTPALQATPRRKSACKIGIQQHYRLEQVSMAFRGTRFHYLPHTRNIYKRMKPPSHQATAAASRTLEKCRFGSEPNGSQSFGRQLLRKAAMTALTCCRVEFQFQLYQSHPVLSFWFGSFGTWRADFSVSSRLGSFN